MMRQTAVSYGSIRSLTAGAQRVSLKDQTMAAQNRPYATWQTEAWTGYKRIGEIHYGLGLVANIMSRVRLYAGAVMGSDQSPVEASKAAEEGDLNSELAQAAQDAMADLTANDFANLIRTFSLNISVPGECYLVHLPDENNPEEKTWTIRSVDEIELRTDFYLLRPMRGAAGRERQLPKSTFVARIWRSDAQYSEEPDSSMAAVADSVEELLLIQRLVRSTIRSRLNAGILFVPDDVAIAGAQPAADEEEVEDNGADFLDNLIDSMVTPVGDEGNASSVVPMLLTGPGDAGGKIKHITFERSSDEWLVNRQERALERILQGLDIPKEVVTGLAQVKYANAIVIDENLYRANIEPLCLMLADALTKVYLRPVLAAWPGADGQPKFDAADLDRVTVWYDPSEIVTRPNQAQDASDGFDKFLIGPDTWRREHGFSENDKPSESEMAFMLLARKGELPPEVTQALLQLALPETLGAKREENLDAQVVKFPESAKNILTPVDNGEVSDVAVGEAQ